MHGSIHCRSIYSEWNRTAVRLLSNLRRNSHLSAGAANVEWDFPFDLGWHVGWESQMGKSNVTDPHKVEWDGFPWPKGSFLWSKLKMHSHGRLAVRGGGAYRCAGAAALGRRCVPLRRAGPPRLGVPRSGEPAARVAPSQSPCEHARPGAIRRQDGTGKRLASIFRVPPDAYARSQRALIFSKKYI